MPVADRLPTRRTFLAACVASGTLAACSPQGDGPDVLRIASKGFGEQDVLANMLKLLALKHTPLQPRIVSLNNDLLYGAIKKGEIDTYVEYTGTALMNILKAEPLQDSEAVYALVRKELGERFGIAALARLGFDSSTRFAMKEERAQALGITRFSQVAALAPQLRLAASQVFLTRPDSFPAVERIYAPKFKEIVTMEVGLNQKALEDGLVDVIYATTTAGRIRSGGLRLIEDDRHAFVPYDAVPLVRQDVLARRPVIGALYAHLQGRLNNTAVQSLNERVDVQGQSPEAVASDWLKQQGLL